MQPAPWTRDVRNPAPLGFHGVWQKTSSFRLELGELTVPKLYETRRFSFLNRYCERRFSFLKRGDSRLYSTKLYSLPSLPKLPKLYSTKLLLGQDMEALCYWERKLARNSYVVLGEHCLLNRKRSGRALVYRTCVQLGSSSKCARLSHYSFAIARLRPNRHLDPTSRI